MLFNYTTTIDTIYDLQLFADLNTQTTLLTGEGNDLSPEMKTYYSDYLIDNATPKLVHDQFAQKHPIPKNGGKTIEFRKYNPLGKALTPLTEGVTPDGQSLHVTTLTAEVKQYGGYITLSDMLLLTAIDNNQTEAAALLGDQAGVTLDTITRDVLAGALNVVYADGGASRATAGKLTVTDIKNAVRLLKNQNAKKIDNSYVCIIHPDVSYDLTEDPKWEAVKEYDPSDWYEGEIGRIHGVRFVETTEAKVWGPGTDTNAGQSGVSDKSIYAVMVLGANAYGTTDITGGGLQYIAKQLGSAGTADPLNQRATVGWKATKTAERLVENFMVKIECTSEFNAESN